MANQILQRVRALIAADVPVMLWGPPGCGKTATLVGEAEDRKAHLEVLILSQLDPVDIASGILVPDANGLLRQSPSPWVRRVREALDRGLEAWVMFDEASNAPASCQAAALRVLHEREACGVSLKGAKFLLTGNPPEHAADGGWMSAPMANRMGHIPWSVDAPSWCAGTLRGWRDGWKDAPTRAMAASIATYLAKNVAALAPNPPSGEALSRAWPSPRSWTFAARGGGAAGGPRSPIAEAIVADCVGAPAASEWATAEVARDLADSEDYLHEKAKLPTRGDLAMAACSSLVAAALADQPDREERLRMAWRVLAKARPDVVIIPARALLDGGDGEIPDEAESLGKRIRGVQ